MFTPVRWKHTVFTMLSLVALAAAIVIAGYGGSSSDLMPVSTTMPSDTVTADVNIQVTWMEIGNGNQAVVRAVTSYMNSASLVDSSACPLLMVDGTITHIALRVAAGTPAQHATASTANDSKTSSFPVNAYETTMTPMVEAASISSHVLPLPRTNPQHVVTLTDTGYHMKKSSNALQSYNGPLLWPFTSTAVTAAKMSPDLMLHISGYHYHENARPPDVVGCQDSP